MIRLKLLFGATLLAAAMAGTACGTQNNNNGDNGATTVPPVATAVVPLEETEESEPMVATTTPAAPAGGGAVATLEPTVLATNEAMPAPTEALPTSELANPTTESSLGGTAAATEEADASVGSAPTSSADGATTGEPGMAELNGMNPASVSELMDYKVQNSQGEDLGEIEDLMIDLTNEQVRYAVLSFGGFLSIGDKLFAIPVSALRTDPTHELVIFDVDKETLENAPGFDNNNWPDFANPEWDVPIQDYWRDHIAGADTGSTAQDSMTASSDQNTANQNNTTSQSDQVVQSETTQNNTSPTISDQMAQNGTVTPEANLAQGDTSADQDKMLLGTTMRASELLDRNIESAQGDEVGEIQDLVVDLDSGRVLYAVLSFGGFANIGDKYFAIPLRVLNFNHESNAFAFDVNEDMLQNAPSFSRNDWPDNVSPNVGEEAREYWDNELSMQ